MTTESIAPTHLARVAERPTADVPARFVAACNPDVGPRDAVPARDAIVSSEPAAVTCEACRYLMERYGQ